MLGSLNNLNGRQIAHIHRYIGGQRHLWQTKGARVWVRTGADDLKRRQHGVAHVGRSGAEAEIEVEKGRLVALEPSWLYRDCAALDGPFGAVG